VSGVGSRLTSQTWAGHWHGFGPWTGSGDTYKQEGRRRPGENWQDPQTRSFVTETLPPMKTGHWLMRGAQVTETWTSVEEAVAWLQARYAANPPLVREDGKAAYCSLEWKVEYALDVLPRGVDVTWCYWMQSRMLTSYSVVCCPNLHEYDLPCPLPLPSNVTVLDTRRKGNVPSALAPA
jgi:hypothetical protein